MLCSCMACTLQGPLCQSKPTQNSGNRPAKKCQRPHRKIRNVKYETLDQTKGHASTGYQRVPIYDHICGRKPYLQVLAGGAHASLSHVFVQGRGLMPSPALSPSKTEPYILTSLGCLLPLSARSHQPRPWPSFLCSRTYLGSKCCRTGRTAPRHRTSSARSP